MRACMQAGGSSFATLGSSGGSTEIGPIPEGEVSHSLNGLECSHTACLRVSSNAIRLLHVLQRHGRELACCAWQLSNMCIANADMSGALMHALATRM